MVKEGLASELLSFQINRGTANIAKMQLSLFEDLKTEHAFFLKKLKEQLPQEYHKTVDMLNYFTDEKFSYLRKKVLDEAGSHNRGLISQLEFFSVDFNGNHS
jgi:hypothetical protein